ncbi:LysR family transcriptional regulator [bacterium]|nr:LysR family transcriptional regulator [bacterium]
MNTKQIDYILELAQTKNFNRAAENLFISQSTLTYQIKEVEKELKFMLFERSGKGAVLTPAGKQFVTTLKSIKEQIQRAIEQGQNFSRKYSDNITIGMPVRSCLYFLPQAIKEFHRKYVDISITPIFNNFYHPEEFLRGNQDILFTFDNEMKHVPDTRLIHLYTSKIYLITKKDDELAKLKTAKISDLKNRTLMIGGGSPPQLKALQQKIINSINIDYFNSENHDTTITNILADKGICLTPGFFKDYTNELAWIPFECEEDFKCYLCIHSSDRRACLKDFIDILQNIYKEKSNLLEL